MPSIRDIIDRPFVKEDAAHHAGVTMGQLIQWLPMIRLNPDLKRTPSKGRPRQLFSLSDVVTLAVFRTMTRDLKIDRRAAAGMIESICIADIASVLRSFQEDGLDLQYMRVAALRHFAKCLEEKSPKGWRSLDKNLKAQMKKTRLQVRDALHQKIVPTMPATSYWLVFLVDQTGAWYPRIYVETGTTATDQNFFFSLAAHSRFFWSINFGEVTGEVCRSIFSDSDSYHEMLDQIIGDDLLNLLLTEG